MAFQRTDLGTTFPHLPSDVAKAIEDYQDKCEDGEITFDGEFAHKPDSVPDLEMEFFASRLPDMDISHG